MKRTSILLVALLALFVAACTSEGASPSATAEETVSATPTEEATPEPVASEDPIGSDIAIPSLDIDLNGDPELADRLPDSIGGQPIQVFSMRGDQFAGAGSSDPAFDTFLESVGAEYEDVSVAFGGSQDGSVGVFAFRISGVPEDQLEEQFLNANEAAGEISGVTEQDIGGKQVWTATSTDPAAPGTAYIYVRDDTVYFLTGTEDQAAEILGALP